MVDVRDFIRYREPGKPDKASRHLSPKHPQVVLSGVRSFRQRLEHVGMPGVQQPDDEYRQRDWNRFDWCAAPC